MRLEWSPRAERELSGVYDYIAQDSPLYARQFAEKLVQAIEALPDFPRKGRVVPEAGYRDDVRELILQGYRIIYRLHGDDLLQVVTLLNGTRDLANMPAPWSE